MADATTHPAETVLAFMRRQGIELESGHIVLALSGGLDSVCLAHLLADLRKSQKFDLSLAHVNHHLRADSDVDEAFCTALAARLQLPLSVTHLDPRARGQASVEAWARDQRYAALEKVADQLGADWIATAHHADDQVETVLMRLQQGSSLLTLAGIRPVNGRVIRPLLELSRAQIAKWAAERRLQWIEDPTNTDVRFLRNSLRHGLLKDAAFAEGGIRETLLRLSHLAQRYERRCADASAFVVSAAVPGSVKGSFALQGDLCLSSDGDVMKLALKALAQAHMNLSTSFGDSHWQSFRQFVKHSSSGKVFDLSRGMKALKNRQEVVFYPAALGTSAAPMVLTPGIHRWGGHEIRVDRSVHKGLAPQPYSLRARRSGDKIRTRGGHNRLVSDIMMDAKLSVLDKRHWPVVARPGGRAVWVPGLGAQADKLQVDSWRMQWRQLSSMA
ncbi:MAG: tRNA lysidine(34) synthetase TilS [Candidatus Marinimicrobia bacterium]|nr:tRNA lysidine(34) synthetase TilS [Candidatus Neomarinimicrobiota bacterium]